MEAPQSPDGLIIEPLTTEHNLRKFRSGESEIDIYLRSFARRNSFYGYGRTYVATQPGHSRVWAYYSLSANHIDISSHPSRDGCPHKIAIALLGRVGVDNSIQGLGIGRKMMGHAFETTLEAAQKIGIHAIVLDAKNEALVGYYARFGFERLMDDPLHLYLPLSLLVQA